MKNYEDDGEGWGGRELELFTLAAAVALFVLVLLTVVDLAVGADDDLVTVSRVVDGDTLTVGDDERVRILGMDAPERGKECFADEATEMLREIIAADHIELETVSGEPDKDVYERSLRKVTVTRDQETFDVALVLIANGAARADWLDGNIAMSEDYRAAETEAREGGKGMWGACSMSDLNEEMEA